MNQTSLQTDLDVFAVNADLEYKKLFEVKYKEIVDPIPT